MYGLALGVMLSTDTFLTGRYVGSVSQYAVLSVNVVMEKAERKGTVKACCRCVGLMPTEF